MNRLYWNLRTGLAGGFFLMADKCDYCISLYRTNRGQRADIIDGNFNIISSNLSISYAKRKVKLLNSLK